MTLITATLHELCHIYLTLCIVTRHVCYDDMGGFFARTPLRKSFLFFYRQYVYISVSAVILHVKLTELIMKLNSTYILAARHLRVIHKMLDDESQGYISDDE